jgi:four helix bundle protein
MQKYRSLDAWKRAREASLLVLRATDQAYHPRALPLFGQLRRATISIEANIVEGYALGTPQQFRRHLRIAIGSAAEAQALAELAVEIGYLPAPPSAAITAGLDRVLGCLHGLLRATERRCR